MIANVISVCIGGMIGTGLRYAIKVNMSSTAFTLPTFVSNAAGCLLLGIIVAIAEQSNMSDVLRLGLIVGCCGALTTFSTIIYDIIKLLSEQAFSEAVTYFVSTNLMGIVMFGIGFIVTTKCIKWLF